MQRSVHVILTRVLFWSVVRRMMVFTHGIREKPTERLSVKHNRRR